MNFDEPLMVSKDESIILPPSLLAKGVTFGEAEVLGKQTSTGMHVRAKQRRVFQLFCQHFITAPEDIGGACSTCIHLATQQGHPPNPWQFLVCKECRRRCSVPFCPVGNVLCPDHAAEHPSDKKIYCPAHFAMLEENARLGESKANLKRFVVSLFNTNGKLLP